MTATVTASDLRPEFVKLRREGLSYRAIAQKFGLSHERVRQVVVGEGNSRDWALPKKEDSRAELIAEISAWLEENGPVARNQVIAKFGISRQQLARMISDLPAHQILAESRSTTPHFSDEDVVFAIQRVWSMVLERNPGATGLSYMNYERLRRPSDPSASALVARYGWESACHLSGVPAGISRPKSSYASRWSDQDILRAVHRYVEDALASGERPSYLGYERWQQFDEDSPSGSLVRIRLRPTGLATWPDMVAAAQREFAA